jgi:hypothetical protein
MIAQKLNMAHMLHMLPREFFDMSVGQFVSGHESSQLACVCASMPQCHEPVIGPPAGSGMTDLEWDTLFNTLSLEELRVVVATWPLKRENFSATDWQVWSSPGAVRAWLDKDAWVERAMNCRDANLNDVASPHPMFRLSPDSVLRVSTVLQWFEADLPAGHILSDLLNKARGERVHFGVHPGNYIGRREIEALLERSLLKEQAQWPVAHPLRELRVGGWYGNLKLGMGDDINNTIDLRTLQFLLRPGVHRKMKRLPRGHPLRFVPFGCHRGSVKMGEAVDNVISRDFVSFLLSDDLFLIQNTLQCGDPLRFENHVFQAGKLKLGLSRYNWLSLQTMRTLCLYGRYRHLLPVEHPLQALRFGAFQGQIKTQPRIVILDTNAGSDAPLGNVIDGDMFGLRFLLSTDYRVGIHRLHPGHVMRTLCFGFSYSSFWLSHPLPFPSLYNSRINEQSASFLMSAAVVDAQAALPDGHQLKCQPLHGDMDGFLTVGTAKGVSLDAINFFLLSPAWRNYSARLHPEHQLAPGKFLNIQRSIDLYLLPAAPANYVSLRTLKLLTAQSTIDVQKQLPLDHFLRFDALDVQGHRGDLRLGPEPSNWLSENSLRVVFSRKWMSFQATLPAVHMLSAHNMRHGCSFGGIKWSDRDDDWVYPQVLDSMANGTLQLGLKHYPPDCPLQRIFLHGGRHGNLLLGSRTSEPDNWVGYRELDLFTSKSWLEVRELLLPCDSTFKLMDHGFYRGALKTGPNEWIGYWALQQFIQKLKDPLGRIQKWRGQPLRDQIPKSDFIMIQPY